MNKLISSKQATHPHILVIENNDSHADWLMSILCGEGYMTVFFKGINEALQALGNGAPHYQGVLLNLNSLDPSDYRLVKKLINLARNLKIRFALTGGAESNQALVRSISFDSGCFHLDPMTPDALIATFAYSRSRSNLQKTHNSAKTNPFHTLPGLVSLKLHFKTIQEAKTLAEIIAHCFPDPERVKLGLNELMLNAIEHGNLGISYFEKSLLLKQGIWLEELTKRMSMPDNATRFVELEVIQESDRITVSIKDQGQGFDWHQFMDFAPDRLSELHGRGIAMAKMLSFDTLEYMDGGRIVKASVLFKRTPALRFD